MRREISATAPGKVVLSGEYAVLDGAPAICMAVERRAIATIREIGGEFSNVAAPGLTDSVGRFSTSDGVVQWQSAQEPFGLIDSVWRAMDSVQEHSLSIDLDTSNFVDSVTRRKLGIGSSAAITVALCAALSGMDDSAKLSMAARRAHTDLQCGVGSGVDIACSLHGGLIEYRMEGSSVTSLVWPKALHYRLIWSGVSASTRDKLSKLDAITSRSSRVLLSGAAQDIAMAWRSGDAQRIISEYRDYIGVLRKFSVDHDLGIFDAGHDDIMRIASTANLVYKPCGAGGGDIGILFGENETELDSMLSLLPAGRKVLDCKLSEAGVMLQDSQVETA